MNRRRPRKDERWKDSKGELWQVEHVGMIERTLQATRTLAFVRFRHISGITAKVMPQDLDTWSREAPDPLEGRRRELSTAIRDGATVIIFPGEECPVRKGEVYHLASGRILIDRCARKIVKGRPTECHVGFIRLLEERPRFLRRVVPGAKTDELVKPPNALDIERARIDGNYRTSPERGGDDLAVVPPDWEDRGVTERKKKLKEARAEIERERLEADAMAAIKRTVKGLTPDQALVLLAQIQRDCESAEKGELKSAA